MVFTAPFHISFRLLFIFEIQKLRRQRSKLSINVFLLSELKNICNHFKYDPLNLFTQGEEN